ncbi:hypothetical protein R3P38DRAFT_3206790 [Favolaschia claudopus]|uniref:DUF6589 domain-containing protein n=1 Tax=Favolaschia claudopus TaxID=2862362 RepID=A0AAW0AKV3_9AGAR
MMRQKRSNRWTILSSEIDTDVEVLPPSDPPDPLSSDSETEEATPTEKMPALTSLLGIESSAPQLRQRQRGSSVPPQNSPDDVDISAEHPTSDDIIFTPRKERLILRQRAEQQRQKSRLLNREQKVLSQALTDPTILMTILKADNANVQRLEAEKRAELEKEKRRLRRNQMFDDFLKEMKENDISLAEFLDHVFNPETQLNSDWRWRGFFAHQTIVERIFGYWTTSRYNQTTRSFLHNWATNHVSRVVFTESRAITQSGILNKTKKAVNERFFIDFSLANLAHTIRGMAPTVFRVFDSFSTTTRQLKSATEKFLAKKELASKHITSMKGAAALTLLRGASQNNNYAQAVNGMYLAATGAQRQHFPVLGVYGFSIGYTSIISSVFGASDRHQTETEKTDAGESLDGVDDAPGVPAIQKQKKKKKRTKKTKPKRVRGPGLLSVLRDACMATARSLAKSNLSLLTYDNINLMNRIAEQILGRKSAQENGTCATLIPLHNAKLEHMLTASLDASILNARPLTLEDIMLNQEESTFLTKNMVHTILRIVVLHGGEGFERWRKDLDASQPVSDDVIEVHKTPLHPLPAMEIDESSITGNVEVVEEIMRVLGFKPDDPEYGKYVQIIAGDQLTIARQRSILNVRLGHESGPHSWRHIVLMPGLFHAKIADCHGVLETHFGKPSAGARSPGSLGFHNSVLDRLPITLTSLPPFRTCRDLIMVSLYARVLHCLLLVSGHDSLEDCAASIDSWQTLIKHAEEIYKTYTDVDRVQELRERRIPEERAREFAAKATKKGQKSSETPSERLPHIRKGDMVFENAVLFLRDALLTREFADAIKSGDSGRIVIILRLWAFSYRGNGRTKYAHEMLHILHNLICVWTNELRYIVLQNWLANPQGKIKAFVEIDLVQEHLNFWIKKIYKADGAGHSWDWLALVSPCVDILRQLANRMNVELGNRQGSKHATPDLAADIAALMASLNEHEVYVEKEGRVLDDDEKPVPDVISVGMAALTHGTSTTPLAEFNEQFESLRKRRHLTPVADLLPLLDVRDDAQTPTVESGVTENASAGSDDEFPELPWPESQNNGGDESDEEQENEEDMLADSPTLTRFEERDVELDIDGIPEWDLDGGESEEDDSDSDLDSDDDEDD